MFSKIWSEPTLKIIGMRKGYVIVILFSIIIPSLQALKYRMFIKKDFGAATMKNFVIHAVALSSIYLICGLLLVRYYYKMKDK